MAYLSGKENALIHNNFCAKMLDESVPWEELPREINWFGEDLKEQPKPSRWKLLLPE